MMPEPAGDEPYPPPAPRTRSAFPNTFAKGVLEQAGFLIRLNVTALETVVKSSVRVGGILRFGDYLPRQSHSFRGYGFSEN